MKAMVWTRYGPPEALQLQEVETPTPKDHEVLIRVYATTVSAGDCETRSLNFPLLLGLGMRLYAGLRRPTRIKIIGQELAGEIEAVGKEVLSFKPGDQVFAALGFGMGAYAEYKCLPEHPTEMEGVLARKPSNVTYEEAAAVPVGGLNAWHFLRQGKLQRGQKVAINGAGGSIGTIAVQLAKHFGAEVTAVDSTGKLDMLRSIGADQVVDYTQEDFTKGGQTYDVIFDVVGKASFSGCIRSLTEGGIYLIAYPRLSQMARGWWTSRTSSKKVIGGNASYRPEDLEFLKELIEAGEMRTVIDRRYPLEEIAEAHRYVESGHKKGNVVITVG
jgi:NADPH:quinone reductase-like Zn-dependent oxidoreductase